MAILIESFSPLKSKLQKRPLLKSKSEVMWQAMLFLILSICHVYCTGLNWFEPATATTKPKQVLMQFLNANAMFPPEVESPMVTSSG